MVIIFVGLLSLLTIATGFTPARIRHSALWSTGARDFSSAGEKISFLTAELCELGDRTNRGFKATPNDRKTGHQLINELSKLNLIREPAQAYYRTANQQRPIDSVIKGNEPSAAGKWTLIYTDAPDITSLQRTNPFADLGRIGQNCDPPYIENIIEWKRPSWLPDIGPDRILQKVVTKGTANDATTVNLTVVGIRLETNQIPPLDLGTDNGLPFGRFQILYLDDELRITRTSQNYVAVNRRLVVPAEEWF